MITNEIKDEVSEEAYKILELAVARIQLDLSKVSSISKRYNFDILLVKQGNYINIFEYTLSLHIKLIHEEYGDFTRAISPLLTDLFEIILRERCKIDCRKYCKKIRGVLCWNKRLLETTEDGKRILKTFNEEFANSYDLFKENASNS